MSTKRWMIAAACLLAAQHASAQALTATLFGTVKDEQGAPVRGASVRATSSALLGGAETTTTDDGGEWRFPALSPGAYTLRIELAGFAPFVEEHIQLGAGASLSRRVQLAIGSVAESVVVQGGGSQIEARATGIETRVGRDYLETIPTRRFSMFDAIRAAPGVSATSPSSGSVNTVSAFGSGGNENLFLIDGTNFTCPCSGVARAEPGVDVIQEVQVRSVGVSVEYGNVQGTVFNVVTRQGSDRFQGDASAYWQTSGLTGAPVHLAIPGTAQQTGYERALYRDVTANAGGPIVRNRVWFFAGYQYLRDYDSQPGTDPSLSRKYEQNKYFGKFTERLGRTTQVMQSFHDEAWVNPQTPTRATPFAATQRPNASVPTMTLVQLTRTPSAHTAWDVRVGRFDYLRHDDPSTGDWTTSSHVDRATGVSSGNPQTLGSLRLARTTAKATLTRYGRRFAGAAHDLMAGASAETGEHEQPSVIPGGVRYIDNGGQPFQAVSAPPSNVGGRFVTGAVFGSDTIALGERLTVSGGVRFDHSRAESQDLHGVDAHARQTDAIVHGLGTLYTWNVVSPRLGATVAITADGRTILRGSYGRFYQGVLTGELSSVHPGSAPLTTTAFEAATGGYTRLVSIVDPTINVRIDGATRAPHTDEFSVGVDRDLARHVSAAAAVIHKRGEDFIGWIDTGGHYAEKLASLPDGRVIRVFDLTNGTASRRFLLTNPAGYTSAYDGLILVLEKRRSNRWQMLGSYTLSRAAGLQASSGATAADAQVSTIAPNGTFGRDPNNLLNAYGRLPNDRPHMARAMASYEVPRVGLTLAANLQYLSGKPWAATAQVNVTQGDQRIFLESRGSRRLPSQALVDVRVSKRFRIGTGVSADLMLDVLNALNSSAVESIATDNLFAATFGQPTVFVDPRRAMLGVRLNAGR